MAEYNEKCELCLNSRTVFSENGVHFVCCLSSKAAMCCRLGTNDSFIYNPTRGDSEEKTS